MVTWRCLYIAHLPERIQFQLMIKFSKPLSKTLCEIINGHNFFLRESMTANKNAVVTTKILLLNFITYNVSKLSQWLGIFVKETRKTYRSNYASMTLLYVDSQTPVRDSVEQKAIRHSGLNRK